MIVLIGLLATAYNVSAQNSDILWQKTLTKDTIPIASIAIAEGKYVAVLKGDEIVILDYMTGDSIRAFAKPIDMLRTDIFLGKNGEKLFLLTQSGFLRIWDVFSGEKLNDINMNATRLKGSLKSFYGVDFQIDCSFDGRYIAVLTGYSFYEGPDHGSKREVYIFNTVDSVYSTPYSVQNLDESYTISANKDKTVSVLGKSMDLNFSPSGNYLLNNITDFFCISPCRWRI